MPLTYSDLGAVITSEWEKLDMATSQFMEDLAEPMGLKNRGSVMEYVHYFKQGDYYGTSSNNPKNRKGRLERLAIFLYALGFSNDDERHAKVIAGVRERAENMGERFEFPPPEDKKLLLDKIKEKYSQKNADATNAIPASQNAIPQDETKDLRAASVEDRVESLLSMPVLGLHDSGTNHNDIKLIECYLLGFSQINSSVGVISIEVQYKNSVKDHYNVYYPNSGSDGIGGSRLRALKDYLEHGKGRKALIAHNHPGRNATIQFIRIAESDILYLRDNTVASAPLRPYSLAQKKFVGV